MADAYMGSADELAEILESWSAHELLCAWRDAAVARHLAEAGAVHPGVHTPTRFMQWLSEHGWQAAAPSDPDRIAAPWVHRDTGYRIFVSLHPEVADYSRYTTSVLAEAAPFAGFEFEQALLEIALLPDEVA